MSSLGVASGLGFKVYGWGLEVGVVANTRARASNLKPSKSQHLHAAVKALPVSD